MDIVGYVGMPPPARPIDTSAVTHQHRWDSSEEASSVSSKLAGAVKCRAGLSLLAKSVIVAFYLIRSNGKKINNCICLLHC